MIPAFVDIEADDLMPMTSRIWVAVVKKLGKHYVCFDRESFLGAISDADEVVLHNGLGFDLPALAKVWKVCYDGNERRLGNALIVDTFFESGFWFPDRQGHGLEWWGKHLGMHKGNHKDFSQLSDEMIEYCKRDTDITEAVYHELKKEMY